MDSSTWITLLDQVLIPLITAIVLPILLMFVKKAVDTFAKKTGLEISKENRAQLDALITKGVSYAEEQAHKAAKNGGDTPKSSEKLANAVTFVKTSAKALGVEVNGENLADMIEAKLFETRAETTE